MTNLEIAQNATLRPISQIASAAQLSDDDFEPLGRFKGKLTWEGIQRLQNQPQGKLVLVTATTPTPHGEGKTTTTIGLSQALTQRGVSAISATREPALGPIFGVKGGACGGGYSQVLPMEDINLFFTGDFPAISSAHNLISAMLDAHLFHGNATGIDSRKKVWPRTIDMNDRALRDVIVGLGGSGNGVPREEEFVITPASEVMATLCLAQSMADLKARIGRMVVGLGKKNVPVSVDQIGATGAACTLLRDALRPNLVQTIEGGAALVHGGPFGNIAHGCSSVVASKVALGMADYTVTEAGFASDLGAEKFLHIVVPQLGKSPDAAVLVTTVRALKYHGEGELSNGLGNLKRHYAHMSQYGFPVVVSLNRFVDDTPEEIALIRSAVESWGGAFVNSNPWGEGGTGCLELADWITSAPSAGPFTPVYNGDEPILEKLQKLVRNVYGGNEVRLTVDAEKALKDLTANGFGNLPVCVAKTQSSLSDDPKKLGAPTGFDLTVRDFRVSAGAGFVVAIAGDILRMPGLGKTPAALSIDIDEDGKITGLF